MLRNRSVVATLARAWATTCGTPTLWRAWLPAYLANAATTAKNLFGFELVPHLVEVDVFPMPVERRRLHESTARADRHQATLVDERDFIDPFQRRQPLRKVQH